MSRRFVSIWLYDLITDWFSIRNPGLRAVPFVTTGKEHGRVIVTASNAAARKEGIKTGMVLADARVLFSGLKMADEIPNLADRLLKRLAEWCIRFSPVVAVDRPDGLLLDVTGCSHLWGGDENYLKDIIKRFHERGYHLRTGLADTPGAAWAIARYGKGSPIVAPDEHISSLMSLPPAALRIDQDLVERLYKLGLHTIQDFISMPRSAMRRRFGQTFLHKLDQALGNVEEIIQPVIPLVPYQERLPCLEPISTATGIEIALRQLLEILCSRLMKEAKGIRQAVFKCYRVDGKNMPLTIGTVRPTANAAHLFKLFEDKLVTIEPGFGIELFVLEAPKVEDHTPVQMAVWNSRAGLKDAAIAELLDRMTGKLGTEAVHRYLPAEHYWPERSFKMAASLDEQPAFKWRTGKRRPPHIMKQPQPVQVTAPVPDYPPMNFRYRGQLHTIVKADGPERIEQEWWLSEGQHRDYYIVEDEKGRRYWIFRLGHYDADKSYGWYLHGFFA